MRETRAAGTKVFNVVVLLSCELCQRSPLKANAMMSVFDVGLTAHPSSEEEFTEFVVGNVRRPAIPYHLAEAQDDGSSRDRHRLLGILLDEQDGLAGRVDAQQF